MENLRVSELFSVDCLSWNMDLKLKEKGGKMRPMPMEFVTDPDDQGSAMEVDDVDTPEIFGEGVIASDNKLADADFFNNFEDDFDDSDID
ncbi:hypothetical protein Godav_000134 [Gossypium davidsonii]|uniref:Small acidic protein 1 n=1 Tax=Gossypium davidsonii TaxID=34287 RepID=A0A7J8TH51_GOSDV|nr:hypothetical protein [Gossypium davidsonii]